VQQDKRVAEAKAQDANLEDDDNDKVQELHHKIEEEDQNDATQNNSD
jgi:hypothetical protein